ncbi:MAG TPA: class I SAM-dependent methyltransferase [Actinopolymorphaceae bacterium]
MDRDLPQEMFDYYLGTSERDRLSQGVGELEAVRTRDLIGRHLPPPPATVLDVGGAAGVHALWLARQGYAVHLIDAVPRHVEQARAASETQPDHPLAACTVGDARRLEAPDGSVDAVLLLGPLYHLTERADRVRALAEARRVLRPGGVVLAAAISRFASFLNGVTSDLLGDPDFVAIVHGDLASGQHRNPTGDHRFFTTTFFHRPDELREEMAEAGLRVDRLAAVEGAAMWSAGFDAAWNDPATREILLDVLAEVESEPTLIGASAHFLGIGYA